MNRKIEAFVSYLLQNKRYSKNTIVSYKIDLIQFNLFASLEGFNSVNKINDRIIRQWIMKLKKESYSSVSVNRKIIALRSFFKYAILVGWVRSNPTRKIISLKTPVKLPKSIPQEVMDKISLIKFKDGYLGFRDKSIILTFYCTGVRLSELINLKVKNINFINKHIKVLGKRNKERIIPIQQELINLFNQLLEYNNNQGFNSSYLFLDKVGKKLLPKQVYNIVKESLSQITTQSNLSPHVLRHTFATHMLENKAEINAIKELLGHSSLATTQMYTNNSLQELKNIYKQSHPKGN